MPPVSFAAIFLCEFFGRFLLMGSTGKSLLTAEPFVRKLSLC